MVTLRENSFNRLGEEAHEILKIPTKQPDVNLWSDSEPARQTVYFRPGSLWHWAQQGCQRPRVIPECAPVRDVLCDMKINFLRLYQPSYQREKWGGREKRILGIECLPTEAKLNPNLLNSRNLCSTFIISVAWIERMATGRGDTPTVTGENHEGFGLSRGKPDKVLFYLEISTAYPNSEAAWVPLLEDRRPYGPPFPRVCRTPSNALMKVPAWLVCKPNETQVLSVKPNKKKIKHHQTRQEWGHTLNVYMLSVSQSPEEGRSAHDSYHSNTN